MLETLKDSRNVKLLVGLTVVLCVAWTLFTGDLPLLSKLAFEPPPAEGSTQDVGSIAGLVGPMLIQILVIIGGAVVSLVTGLWGFVTGAVSGVVSDFKAGPQTSKLQDSTTSSMAGTATDTFAQASKELVRAACKNDPYALEQARITLRLPVAMALQQEALAASDLETADKYMEELRGLIKPEPVKALDAELAEPTAQPEPKGRKGAGATHAK